ncbi:MAG: DinB family protein [Pyrinomonadaceae bacterium]
MKEFLEAYRLTIEEATLWLREMSDEESLVPRTAGKWSPREIIGHLIDSAANNHQRFVRAQFVDHLSFDGYDQEDWVRVENYANESWPLLIDLWRAYNLHLLHVMAATPPEQLTRMRTHHTLHRIAWQTVPENEPVTLEYFMRDYVGHLEHHLAQILRKI